MPNELEITDKCIKVLLDYENLSDDDFKKHVEVILKIHKLHFGLNKFYLDYLLEFKGKETTHKKDILAKMVEFRSYFDASLNK